MPFVPYSPFLPNFAMFAKVANFAEIATRQGSTFALQIEWPDLWQKFAIFAKIAKIATFQGYTFGIQLAICMMTSFYYKDQNPSAVCFHVQIKAFVIETSLGLPNLNMKGKTKRFGS